MIEKERNIQVVNSPEYRKIFEKTDPILIGYGGSYSYGTNIGTSDIDIRGFAYNPVDELLGINPDFEQYQDDEHDITIYSLKKMLRLLANCNPNCIEILGLRPEEYLYVSEAGRLILDNKQIFLSKKAITTFGGYANAQLNRLLNKSGRAKEEYAANEARSISKADIAKRFDIELVDVAEKNGETLINFKTGKHIPVYQFCAAANTINQIHSDYKTQHRNTATIEHKKLAKHMMHLVRLYYMAFDILERKEIITYRGEEHELLMAIRNGAYLENDQTTLTKEFRELLRALEMRFEEAKDKTTLPDEPNMKAINELAMEINRDYLDSKINSVHAGILEY